VLINSSSFSFWQSWFDNRSTSSLIAIGCRVACIGFPKRYADSFPRLLGSNLSRSMLQRMAGFLCMPVFAWLPRIREALDLQEVDQWTRVLACTAPFATLALYRCIERGESEIRAPPRGRINGSAGSG
jgi:hypothetical protein